MSHAQDAVGQDDALEEVVELVLDELWQAGPGGGLDCGEEGRGVLLHQPDGRSHDDPLLRGGVKLCERREALLHAKNAVIDGIWATVGSTNLDWRSFLPDQELTAVILGAEFGATMRAAFECDLAVSEPITPEAWRRGPITTRAKEMLARLCGCWL